MFFDTPAFLIFLAVVVATCWHLGHRGQNLVLLAASYFFYGWWDWRFVGLLAGSTIIDFVVARRLHDSGDTVRRRALLVLSLAVNIGILGVFKYFNFFASSLLAALGGGQQRLFDILLPPGISFYTLQEIAYIVDVYLGRIEPAASLVDYALFVSLFPHLVAGPIQRPLHLLPQVQRPRRLDPCRFLDGLMMIVSGLFRKCVVADQCSFFADAAFEGRLGWNLPATVLGTFAFALQIYADFSAYSDIARGSAQVLGFHFMVNFRSPYLSTSLREFWQRWHISLGAWLRDYLYIPMGGNRRGLLRTCGNLMATMLIGGLWHGANWTFIVWGGLHGAGLCVERMLGQPATASGRPRWLWFRRSATFCLVCFGWLFFRATSLANAGSMLAGLAHGAWSPDFAVATGVLGSAGAILLAADLRMESRGEEYPLATSSHGRRVALAVAMLLAVLIFSETKPNGFLYFQF